MLMFQGYRHLRVLSASTRLSNSLWKQLAARSLGRMAEPNVSNSNSRGPGSDPKASSSKLVMQIILPRSLVTDHKWPVGPLLAQSAHAATAVLHLHTELPEVKAYLANWRTMRKTVMEVENEDALREICRGLDGMEKKIPYHLWVEQPENKATALALVPNNRPTALKRILDKAGCKLWE